MAAKKKYDRTKQKETLVKVLEYITVLFWCFH